MKYPFMKQNYFTSCATALLLLAALPFQSFSESVPRPEHPRPDAFRANWATLNGEWQFEIDQPGDGGSRGLRSGKDLAQKILVPFCPESRLSGIGHSTRWPTSGIAGRSQCRPA